MQDIDENPAFYFRFMGILDNLFIWNAVLHGHQGYFFGCHMEPDSHLAQNMYGISDLVIRIPMTKVKNISIFLLPSLTGLDYLLEFEMVSVIRVFAERMSHGSAGELDRYATAFLSGAIAHMILYWFKDQNPVSQEQLSELLCSILAGNYFQIQNEYLPKTQ